MTNDKGKIVFIDLETGGLFYYPHLINGNLKQANPIIQIACAVVSGDTLDVVDTLELKVQFNEAECDPQALVINGYQKDNWRDAKPKNLARVELTAFLRKHSTVTKISKRTGNPYTVAMLGGQNIIFDLSFLRVWYGGEFFPADFYSVDVMGMAHLYSMITGTKFGSLSQDALSKYFKIELDGKAHDALADVKVTAQIYKLIMLDLKQRLEF